MTGLESTLVEAWATLSPDEAGSGIGTRRVGGDLEGGGVRVGLDGYGARHLLVPLGDATSARDHRSGGVVLVGQELDVDGEEQLFADLVCVRPELNDVFGALAADVCDALAQDAGNPTRTILRALERWRQLLGPSGGAAEFTLSTAIGLHGELLVLERAHAAAGPRVLKAWTGPERLHHDFRAGRTAVEVKTTTAREGLRVEIHGLEQLDSSADVDLCLLVVRLIRDPAGDTLPEVVNRLIDAVQDAGALLDRLSAAGYRHDDGSPPEQVSAWPRYVAADLAAWKVDDDFPVVRRGHLPAGAPAAIERLRYTVNLAAAGPGLDETELDAVLSTLGD